MGKAPEADGTDAVAQEREPVGRPEAPLISLIVPVRNEEAAIAPFLEAVRSVMDAHGLRCEILFVDAGASDTTAVVVAAAIARDGRVRLVCLSRNFGKEAALTAGLDRARGDAAVPMDVDLQDPPEVIPAFVARWKDGFDVVYGRRASRSDDTFLKRTTAGLFYGLFNRLSHLQIPDNVGDFRLIDRSVIDALLLFREKNRFMKGLFSTVGFKSIGVDYFRPARLVGESKWTYWRLWNFALDGFISFSTAPLRIWTYIGIAVATLSFLYAVFIAVRTMIFGNDVPGYSSLMTVILFMGGVQLISLGIIGEYVGRMFIETKNRPIYLVRKTVNVPEPPADSP
ncbi:MAG: glycosyltransferase family 2 protein [Pararhizobium sp.]